MKKIICVTLLFICFDLEAQQWAGSTTTSDLIYRDGRVLVGGTSLLGSFIDPNIKLIQVQTQVPVCSFLTFRSVGSSASMDIGFCPQFGTASIYSNQVPLSFSTNYVQRMYISTDGNIGIGTNNPQGYKLAVNGSVIFTEAKVKLYANWPDYVFHKNYKLMPLSELEKFIQQNHHLPNIPSAKEIKEKEGFELGDMTIKLLEKIEELTLHIIELSKENEEIKELIRKISSEKF